MTAVRKVCPSCGSLLTNKAVSCDICGQDLSQIESVVTEVPAAIPTPPVGTAGKKAAQQHTGTVTGVRYCSKCGAANETSDTFCYSCGSQLRIVQQKKKAKTHSAKNSPQKVFTTKQWIAVSIASFVLGVVATISLFPAVDTLLHPSSADMNPTRADTDERPGLAQIDAAREAAATDPHDMSAQLRYANILHDAKMLDQAISQYKLYLASADADVDARVDLGICYFEQQKYDEAIHEMEAALRIDPDHQLGNYNLGIVNLNAGNTAKAIEYFDNTVRIDPNTVYGTNAAHLIEENKTP